MTSPAPIPGLAGVEHVGLIVPDLAAATHFFAAVLGAEVLYDVGPFAGPEDWMAAHLAGSSGGHIHRLRVLQVANGPVIEMFELSRAAGAAPAATGNGHSNGWHIAFYVEDMDRALAGLKAHGVPILSGPVIMTEGPSAGLTWLYFRTPWGQQLELVSYPNGIAAYREMRREVWRPRQP